MWKAWEEHRLGEVFLWGNVKEKLLASPGHKWDNDIKKDLEEIG
jgi:hypothetical protein